MVQQLISSLCGEGRKWTTSVGIETQTGTKWSYWNTYDIESTRRGRSRDHGFFPASISVNSLIPQLAYPSNLKLQAEYPPRTYQKIPHPQQRNFPTGSNGKIVALNNAASSLPPIRRSRIIRQIPWTHSIGECQNYQVNMNQGRGFTLRYVGWVSLRV